MNLLSYPTAREKILCNNIQLIYDNEFSRERDEK